jgi:succinate dehydrogenase / fumarate reductase, cytochrome b subunit
LGLAQVSLSARPLLDYYWQPFGPPRHPLPSVDPVSVATSGRTTSFVSTTADNMNTDRPVNLALTKFRFPLTALLSITHRITGVLLFAGTALLLYLAHLALDSEQGFQQALSLAAQPWAKLLIWAVLAALAIHVVAGIKHLLLDFHLADGKESGHRATQISILVSVVLVILAGVWIW